MSVISLVVRDMKEAGCIVQMISPKIVFATGVSTEDIRALGIRLLDHKGLRFFIDDSVAGFGAMVVTLD